MDVLLWAQQQVPGQVLVNPPPRSPFTDWLIQHLFEEFPMLGILLLLMAGDIITGLLAGFTQKKLSSKIGWQGMCRKGITLLVIGMAAALDRIQITLPLAKITSAFFIINEALSILENATRSGIPLPMFLVKALRDQHKAVSDNATGSVDIKVKDATFHADIVASDDSKTADK